MVTKSRVKTSSSRDREATEQRILDAIGAIILRDGLTAVGINAIAREAGVSKVLIYRYFGDLDGLYEAFAEQSDFWWTVDEMVEGIDAPENAHEAAEATKLILRRHTEAMRSRPITLAVMAAELEARTPLVIALEAVREKRGRELLEATDRLMGRFDAEGLDVASILLTAAIQYLAARARRIRTYGALDLKSRAGWDRIESSIDRIVDGFFALEAKGL